MGNYLSDLRILLDSTCAGFDRGHVEFAFNALLRGLTSIRQAMGADSFAELAVPLCRSHALYERLGVDPLAKLARQNAVSYTGRAGILDVLFHGAWDPRFEPISDEGRRLFQCTAVNSGTAIALRERRNFIGSQLDQACSRQRGCRILSVGCGHLREATRSVAVIGENFEEFVAIDADPTSLEEVRRSSPSLKIKTVKAGLDSVLDGTLRLGTFHFIYVATAYDYLPTGTAQRLTSALHGLLNPGGRLLIANHRPGFATRAYVEAFLHWQLAARDDQALRALASELPDGENSSLSTFEDSGGYIGYLMLQRSA